MMHLVLLLLAADPVLVINTRASPVQVGNSRDAGTLLNVYVAGQASGAGGLTNAEIRATPLLVDIYSDGGAGASGLTDAQLRATPVPVSGSLTCSVGTVPVTGAFYQATQPVSIASMPSTPVTGTFWQATQPVSVASMPSTPVTGTFWQATQPVSGTVTANAGTGTMNVSCVSGCGSPAVPVVYRWSTPNAVAGANKLHADFFNGSTKVIKVLGVYPAIKTDVAVTGAVALRFDLYRTSAAGTGGTAAQYKSATIDVAGGNITPADTANAALPAEVTAQHLPTGGATISEWIQPTYCMVEETNAATYWCNGTFNILDTGNWTVQALTLRQGQGLLLKQGSVATLNSISFSVVFQVD